MGPRGPSSILILILCDVAEVGTTSIIKCFLQCLYTQGLFLEEQLAKRSTMNVRDGSRQAYCNYCGNGSNHFIFTMRSLNLTNGKINSQPKMS